jgi:sugar phosphate isomerase/epimerase
MTERKEAKAKIAVFPKGFMNELVDGSLSLLEWIEQAGTLGADGLELYPLFLKRTDEPYLLRIKEAAGRQSLDIPMMCSSPDFTHPDCSYRDNELMKMKNMIEVMAVLGPPEFRSCRVLSGQKRPGVSREDGIRWTVQAIEALLPYAAGRGVHLVMENHYKDGLWEHPEFAQASELFLDIIGRISSPWFGVNYDPSNALVAGEEPLELLERVKDRLLTMHASDRYLKEGYTAEDLKRYTLKGYSEALAHGVIGKGLNDYDRIFGVLREKGFRGWISVEDGVNGLAEMAESVRFLRGKVGQYLS